MRKKSMLKYVILLIVAVIALFFCGCKKEEAYDPDKYTVGDEGGKTVYQDVPTKVTRLAYSVYSDMMPEEYEFARAEDGATFTFNSMLNDEQTVEIDTETIVKLEKWVDDYNIRSWDGFSMTATDVLDGGGFRLEIELGTGESIYASGSNAYPTGYGDAADVLRNIISATVEAAELSIGDTLIEEKSFVTEAGFTEEMFDYYAKEDWQKAYRAILADTAGSNTGSDDLETLYQAYAVYDINKDSLPELIIKSGTCEADYVTKVYYFDGEKAAEAGELSAGHTSYYTYPDAEGILEYNAHMGFAAISRVEFDGSKLKTPGEIIFEDDLQERMQKDEYADYTPVGSVVEGSEAIALMPLSYTYGLIDYVEHIYADAGENISDEEFMDRVDQILQTSQMFYGVFEEYNYSNQTGYEAREMGMMELYEKEGLFPYSEGEVVLTKTYEDDYNGDGRKECLAVFSDSESDATAAILFAYQHGRVYGYIGVPASGRIYQIEGGHIYIGEKYGSNCEMIFNYMLDQCVVEYKVKDIMVLGQEGRESLQLFRQDVTGEKGELAVAYLGVAEDFTEIPISELLEQVAEKYSDEKFMTELDRVQCINQPGAEVYLIVPAGENYIISVYEQIWGEDTADGMPKRGKLLYRAAPGEMVLVRGNQSEIVSNIEISMDIFGKEMIYHPELSMENGRLQAADRVVDFTRYDEE